MRAIVQRVKAGSVKVDGEMVGSIGPGLVVFLGVGLGDGPADCAYLAEKVAGLRIFEDAQGLMNRSVLETGGAILCVSQFTLFGDCRKGRRPGFGAAASPEEARKLYIAFCTALREKGLDVATGRFQATMEVTVVNHGPVTILLDSKKMF